MHAAFLSRSSLSCAITSIASPINQRKSAQCWNNPHVLKTSGKLLSYSPPILPPRYRCPCLDASSSGVPIDSTNEAQTTSNDVAEHTQMQSGKPGFVTFYRFRTIEEPSPSPSPSLSPSLPPPRNKTLNTIISISAPLILVASFVLPSLYLRSLFAIVFEDSLLTDFLILFFTEALFYTGAAFYLLMTHHLNSSDLPKQPKNNENPSSSNFSQRVSTVTALILNLIIPLVTMGLVWPWTGPAASAALSPYLAGVVVQFAFERFAVNKKLSSKPVIPILFQVYRLHQLNRAAQLVSALSFAVRGAEVTPHNLEISSSLGSLLNVIQFLGVVCVWSLSSFLMKFFPNTARIRN